jgi:hypothetical protein
MGDIGTSGAGEEVRKGCRRVTIVQTHNKWKTDTCETISGVKRGRGKGRIVEGVNPKMIYFKNLCKCRNVHPPNTTTKNERKKERKKGRDGEGKEGRKKIPETIMHWCSINFFQHNALVLY